VIIDFAGGADDSRQQFSSRYFWILLKPWCGGKTAPTGSVVGGSCSVPEVLNSFPLIPDFGHGLNADLQVKFGPVFGHLHI